MIERRLEQGGPDAKAQLVMFVTCAALAVVVGLSEQPGLAVSELCAAQKFPLAVLAVGVAALLLGAAIIIAPGHSEREAPKVHDAPVPK